MSQLLRSISLASLILVAIYVEPPLSGWFVNIKALCFCLIVLGSVPYATPRINCASLLFICA